MPILDRTSAYIPKLRRLLRPDVLLLLGVLGGLLILLGGLEFINHHLTGAARSVDHWLLTAGRDPDDPAMLRGSHWVDETVRDVTGLGGPLVLAVMVLAVTFFFLARGNHRGAVLLVGATLGGLAVSLLLKDLFVRERPQVVPALMVETSPSFPSGHSMLSAVVYLTLGSLLTRVEPDWRLRFFYLVLAFALTAMVGASRVLLGVHYPTDVMVGWVAGLVWASLCWFLYMALQERGAIESVADAEPGAEPEGLSSEEARALR